MPNWCDDSGYIKGDKSVLDEIWATIHGGSEESEGHDSRPAITALRPCPDELIRTMSGFMSDKSDEYDAWNKQKQVNMAKYGYTDWYGWCVDNWGTKWTPDFEFERHDDTSIWFHGQSAWSPPEELMRYITEIYPVTIEMSYCEESMEYIGASIFAKGKTYSSSAEPEFSMYTFESGDDIDWDAYNDARDADRDKHEALAWARFEMDDADPPRDVLLGRDILPRIENASVSTTLTGEVIVSLDTPGNDGEVTE